MAIVLALAGEGLEREDDVAVHFGLPVEERLQNRPQDACARASGHGPLRERATRGVRYRPAWRARRAPACRREASTPSAAGGRSWRRRKSACRRSIRAARSRASSSGRSRVCAIVFGTLVFHFRTLSTLAPAARRAKVPIFPDYWPCFGESVDRSVPATTLRLYMTLWSTTISLHNPSHRSRRSSAPNAAVIEPRRSAAWKTGRR